MGMKFKSIPNIDTALQIYYRYPEIGNDEIRRLFGDICRSTIMKYKRAALDEQAAQGVKTSGMFTVNTAIAYKVWGIDVEDLEKRRAKLAKLGLAS